MIMVVEDDNDIRELLKMALEIEGYEVLTAENGARALEFIEKGARPNLVLLDLNMPELSGQDLIKHLQNIPTIVLSAASKNVLQAVTGVAATLQKPVDFNLLFKKINQILAS